MRRTIHRYHDTNHDWIKPGAECFIVPMKDDTNRRYSNKPTTPCRGIIKERTGRGRVILEGLDWNLCYSECFPDIESAWQGIKDHWERHKRAAAKRADRHIEEAQAHIDIAIAVRTMNPRPPDR